MNIYTIDRPANLMTCSRDEIEAYYEFLFVKLYRMPVPGVWYTCARQYLIDQISMMERAMSEKICAALTASDLWEGAQPAPIPNLIVKNFDNYLRNYWFHVSVDFVKTEIVDVDSKRGDEIKRLLQNPPAGKRYVNSKAFGVEMWNLIDLPPTE